MAIRASRGIKKRLSVSRRLEGVPNTCKGGEVRTSQPLRGTSECLSEAGAGAFNVAGCGAGAFNLEKHGEWVSVTRTRLNTLKY